LIIHGIFIDYSQWPFSGAPVNQLLAGRSADSYQASAFPNQVASEEYRVVRGQLLDAQTDTLRNRFLRWLTLAGNLAGAFTFSLNEQGIVKGIAAATGVGIPGIATAWPDKTIEQLNRVSDFGFRANKVIPREGSDVIVCFFPIDRFLTRGFRKLFLKSPALFFAPGQMLVDKAVQKDVDEAIGNLLEGLDIGTDTIAPTKAAALRKHLPCFMRVTHPVQNDPAYEPCLDSFGLETVTDPKTNEDKLRVKVVKNEKGEDRKDFNNRVMRDEVAFKSFQSFMALQFINSVSLNRVTITVDGVMAVDVKTIAARIDEINIDRVADCGDAGSQCFWTDITADSGIRKGVIRGSYMTNADIRIADATALHIEELKKIEEASNDHELHFSFKLTAPVPNQAKLHFTVTKPGDNANSQPLESNAFEYPVAYSPAATGIDSAALAGNTVTVKGRGFNSTMVVTLISETGEERKVTPANRTPGQFDVTLPTGTSALKAGCWYVQVQAGGLTSNRSEKFAIAPNPTIVSAENNDKFILVKGSDLVDFSHCGGQQVSFQLQQGTDTPVDAEVVDWNNGKPVLKLPDKVKTSPSTSTNKWKVLVLLNGTAVTTNGSVELKPIS
jgi:hypothetical protein